MNPNTKECEAVGNKVKFPQVDGYEASFLCVFLSPTESASSLPLPRCCRMIDCIE